MSMTIPALGPYVGPYLPLNNVTPFTYRDGLTNSEILASWQEWLNTTVVGFINDNFGSLGDEFVTQVNLLIDEVNNQLTAETTTVNTALSAQTTSVNNSIATLTDYVNTRVQAVIDGSVGVSDPVVHDVINLVTSATRALLDTLYVNEADFVATVVPKWKANTEYAAGALVVSPNGDIVAAIAAFTSGAVFDATKWKLSPTYVPKWRANTAYALGELVVSPNGDIVSAITAFTSGATYSAANWAVSTTYAHFDATGALVARGMSGNAHNVSIGEGALPLATAGINQVAIGYQAMAAATDNGTGIQNGSNVAIGSYALQKSISNQNTAVGTQALQNLVGDTNNGISNNAFGDQALLNLVSGNNNNAFGVQALAQATTGANNTAIGHEAMQALTTGGGNTALGYVAGLSLTLGNLNTLIGNAAGTAVNPLTTGSSNTFVGMNAGLASATQTSAGTAIGKDSKVAANGVAVGVGAQANNAGSVAIGVDSAGTAAVSSTNNLIVLGTALHTVQMANVSISSATLTTAAPAAGGASALPATPTNYVGVTINGVARKIAVY